MAKFFKNLPPFFVQCRLGVGKCSFCGFEGKVALFLDFPQDYFNGRVEAVCFHCIYRTFNVWQCEAPESVCRELEKASKEPERKGLKEKIQDFEDAETEGLCEVCGCRGKVHRFSRRIKLPYICLTARNEIKCNFHDVQEICEDCCGYTASYNTAIVEKVTNVALINPVFEGDHAIFKEAIKLENRPNDLIKFYLNWGRKDRKFSPKRDNRKFMEEFYKRVELEKRKFLEECRAREASPVL